MLSPQDRKLLFDALRPPPGHELSDAVVTSYSLDLLTLLTIPLAFTMFRWDEDEAGEPRVHPMALLEATRRHTDRVTVFCQTGAIAIPARHHRLFTYLEPAVVEVAPPAEEGVFHPKLWVLRFEGAEAAVKYRLVVQSRNLTADRSWDVVLTLDGDLADHRVRGFASSRPLAEFVEALPALAVRPPEPRRMAAVARMADEVRRVEFERPDGFETLRFLPMGLPGMTRWPFPAGASRCLVVSPFVAERTLRRCAEAGKGHVLVARQDQLDALPPDALSGFERVMTLRPEAVADAEADADSDPAATTLAGLHAKLYLVEQRGTVSLYVGSANATDAAFHRNVEFLVELSGPRRRFGIDRFLAGNEDAAGFGALLQPYSRGQGPEAEAVAAERLLRTAQRWVEAARLEIALETGALPETYVVVVRRTVPTASELAPDAVIRLWPLLLPESAAVAWRDGEPEVARFPQVSLEGLSAFVAFDVRLPGVEQAARFVLNLPIVDPPAHRRDAVLRSLLADRDQVRYFLLFLLGLDGELGGHGAAGELAAPAVDGGAAPSRASTGPLLEQLLRALDRDPARLDQIASLVADLRRTDEGRSLLPDGFEPVWDAVWTARTLARG